MPFCWELRGGRRSRADRLPRNEARHPPLNGGGHRVYRKLGFEPIEPYYETLVIGTIFMRRSLIERSGQESARPT